LAYEQWPERDLFQKQHPPERVREQAFSIACSKDRQQVWGRRAVLA
jgi:hypothetical protein